jgi:aspartyl-tRNA(Asn)/glutamyl-tRNA(Gln) amidotransferase subunit B
MQYETVIGLEVHLQLATATKMFCPCQVLFASAPNSLTCPVCLGLPGSLPVINRKAIDYALKVALALDCTVGKTVKFDRKNYYYPDLPKNYQISQYDLPLSSQGQLSVLIGKANKVIRIRRVHLEEDAGKLIHGDDGSLVDYNRAGVPLLEIVSEPDINSPQEAYEYLAALKTLLKYLDVSDCDMEKGSLRCDANISVRPKGTSTLGTKTELKNMNSFRAVKAALEVELGRQVELLEHGKAVIQETRLWDEDTKATVSMRTKEEASDYRYFPEPDLVPFSISQATIESIKKDLPELPRQRQLRFQRSYNLAEEEANFLISEPQLAGFFEACFNLYPQSKDIFNWIKGALAYEMNQRNKTLEQLRLKSADLIDLIKLVKDEKISNLSAKSVLTSMLDKGVGPQVIIKEQNISQVSDEAGLSRFIEEAIAENEDSVAMYLAGKDKALMFLVGQVMKKSQGKANPKKVSEFLAKRLKQGK